ncbi:MAG: GDP-mannose 4,6-dehydratase [Gemmatimonadetes bacterium]|nr:GDP-mannose 4,6-dehydratase [Gemmatimonadota bacterium]
MRVLVTGADGFVGAWLVPHLTTAGHDVVAAVRGDESSEECLNRRQALSSADIAELELSSDESVDALLQQDFDAIVHLAAVASVSEAGRNPLRAWEINTLGTVRLAEGVLKRSGDNRPVFLFVSTAEVYGRGPETPRRETDPVQPVSPYAASKLAAEVGLMELYRRVGLRAIVARPFPHTGPGQASSYVVPAFAERILLAKSIDAPVVQVGNLESVREFLHVADVVEAYRLLIEQGEAGETYNIASGAGVSLQEVFTKLTDVAGHRVLPETDTSLMRSVDLPYLVGDGTKIAEAVGWKSKVPLDQTLAEVVNAQAN